MRGGAQLQRAVGILGPHLRALSLIPATAVCPTGVEDDPVDVTGWEAVLQLQGLHRSARARLGRTRRILSLHGTCPNTTCTAQALYRLEPQDFKDEPPVWCDSCKASRLYADYEWFMVHLTWPESAEAEQVAA
jgi:hypothetical protein